MPPASENRDQMASGLTAGTDDSYKWVALSNTTAAVFMSQLDGSIVIIALPAIFRGIHLDPLAPGNVAYLLWMIMGYRLVQAVLVVTVGHLGDMYGRVWIYNAGFAVFTVASVLLSFDPLAGGHGALWLIGWRALQAVGGSMLTANSAAILTDAFPSDQRGFALGINQVAGLAGMFIGLVAGGLLAALDWRAVFWVNVPVGVFGTLWAYRKLRDTGRRGGGRIDWWGNITFAVGLGAILIAITNGIQPYRHHSMGWTNPAVFGLLAGGVVLLAAVLGVNPLQHLLAASRVLSALPAAAQQTITGREFFPDLMSGPFHQGLVVVFAVAAALAGVAAVASLLRGGRYVHPAAAAGSPLPATEAPPVGGALPVGATPAAEDRGRGQHSG